MKKLIVYYSLTGNVKLIAESIAEHISADLVELKPKKEIPTKGFIKYVWGGTQVIMKQQPELNEIDTNPHEYDLIFIGTPVWSWNYAPPIRSFLSKHKLENKRIGLFCCYQGNPGKTFINLKKDLSGNQFVSEMGFAEPKNREEESIRQAVEWARNVLEW